ncbi:MAG: non-hydrolyzing UDP-N-acetylglucosamine 2-epimerase [Phocaeicola sp.]
MKITIVAGARPNFMKIAPLMRAIHTAKEAGKPISARLVYTGLKDDPSLEPSLFSDLGMRQPDCYLNVESNNFFERFSNILVAFAQELESHPTQVVLVVDDLTPTMACAIVAKKMGVKVAHLVAGIRSFDMDMPKELNRFISDGLSDYLFTAGREASKNLSQTGVNNSKVHFVGNTLIDTLRYNRLKLQQPRLFSILGVEQREYILLTLNKRSLVNNNEALRAVIDSLLKNTNKVIVAPLHSYASTKLTTLGISDERLKIVSPQSYLSFSYMVNHAYAIVTDSGNVAEEATFLGIPCMTLSDYAEHPETIILGTNLLVGENGEQLTESLQKLQRREWKEATIPERWDGHAAERIIQTLLGDF